MIDCGIPFAKMKEDLYKVDTLLLTHAHTDHIKPETLERIRKEFPRINIFGNADIAYRFDIDKVIGIKPFSLPRGRTIVPFELFHDVQTTGYIIQTDGLNILYATDTAKIYNPIKEKIDYFFLESNYDEVKLKQTYRKYSNRNYDARAGSLRHLSTQKCKEFYFVNRRSNESPLIELHQSSRFY